MLCWLVFDGGFTRSYGGYTVHKHILLLISNGDIEEGSIHGPEVTRLTN